MQYLKRFVFGLSVTSLVCSSIFAASALPPWETNFLQLAPEYIVTSKIPSDFWTSDWTKAIGKTKELYKKAVLTGETPDKSLVALNFVTTPNNSFKLKVGIKEAWDMILGNIDSAQSSININMFGWHTDEFRPVSSGEKFGFELLERLCGAARRGVNVNLSVADAFFRRDGLPFVPKTGFQSHLKRMLKSGQCQDATGKKLRYTKGIMWKDGVKDIIGHHDHRKLWIFDGRIAVVGGYTVSDEMVENMYDAVWELRGPVVQQLQSSFLLSLGYRKGALADFSSNCSNLEDKACRGLTAEQVDAVLAKYYPALDASGPEFTSDATIVQNNPLSGAGDGAQGSTRAYRHIIFNAKKNLQLAAPFFTAPRIFDWAINAYDRTKCGLNVDILVPVRFENDMIFGKPSRKHLRRTLSTTQKIKNEICAGSGSDVAIRGMQGGGETCGHLGNNGRLHGKVVLSESWVSMGSTNLDAVALDRQLEMNIISRDRSVIREVSERFFLRAGQSDCSSPKKLEAQENEPPFVNPEAADFRSIN